MGFLSGLVEALAGSVAFRPPSPRTYEVKQGANGALEICSTSGRKIPGEVVKLKTKRNETVIAVLIRYSPSARRTILMSHGTEVDLGRLIPWYREVAQELKVNLCVYDYSGYGCSTGTPSVANTIADIDACYSWLLSRGFTPSDIVLYGQSIGSGPSVNLAARTPKVGGLILHAAFSGGTGSGAGLLYPNLSLMKDVEMPVLVVHGCKDTTCHVNEGKALYAAAKRKGKPYWAADAGHNDVELSSQYVTSVRMFLVDVWGPHYA